MYSCNHSSGITFWMSTLRQNYCQNKRRVGVAPHDRSGGYYYTKTLHTTLVYPTDFAQQIHHLALLTPQVSQVSLSKMAIHTKDKIESKVLHWFRSSSTPLYFVYSRAPYPVFVAIRPTQKTIHIHHRFWTNVIRVYWKDRSVWASLSIETVKRVVFFVHRSNS